MRLRVITATSIAGIVLALPATAGATQGSQPCKHETTTTTVKPTTTTVSRSSGTTSTTSKPSGQHGTTSTVVTIEPSGSPVHSVASTTSTTAPQPVGTPDNETYADDSLDGTDYMTDEVRPGDVEIGVPVTLTAHEVRELARTGLPTALLVGLGLVLLGVGSVALGFVWIRKRFGRVG